MNFEFATVTRIIFGAGRLRELRSFIPSLGSRALVVIGRNTERARPLLALLEGLAFETWTVAGEPTADLVRDGVARARSGACDCVISFGGGSVIDAGKAIAALLTNDGDLFEYLEVIGQGKALTNPAAPSIAIPTTAGTGAEVTRNAVLGSPQHRVKVSLRSSLMLPKVALVDSELTYD